MSIHPLLAGRRSARAYDARATLSDLDLEALAEAARSAPSAYNLLPWRLVIVLRGSADFAAILATLADYNAAWARDASALVVALAEDAAADGTPHPHAVYDLGQAMAMVSVEATSRGLALCQMDGHDPAALAAVIGVPDRFSPRIVAALGTPIPGGRPPEGVAVVRRPAADLVVVRPAGERSTAPPHPIRGVP